MQVAPPHAISWNLTRRCNLACDHCYLDAAGRAGAGDLSTERCLDIVDQLAEVNRNLLLILTGGEPLLRPDLDEIAGAAAAAGMTVVLGTNGTLLDAERAVALRDAGVQGVGISIDSAPDGAHDRLRGRDGSLAGALRGIEACRRAGLEFMVQTSVFRWNRDELADIAALAADRGARAWNVYFLVCTGRGQELTDLSPDEYEATLHELRALQAHWAGRLMMAVRCAPHYRRVVAQEPVAAGAFNAFPSGCPAAIHYARIGPRGEVTPCPYMPNEAGRLDAQRFADVWTSSPALHQLRDRTALQGKCGLCTYRDTCGGCRARALAVLGDPIAEDPSCVWDPAAEVDAAPAPAATLGLPDRCTMPWAPDAIARLDRVPSFLCGLVIQRVEAEARRRAVVEVTPEIMIEVRARQKAAAAAKAPEATVQSADSAQIVWMPDALAQLVGAPDFAQSGIRALVAARARACGRTIIDADFLREVREGAIVEDAGG